MAKEMQQPRRRRAVWRAFWRVLLSVLCILTVLLLYYIVSSLFLHVETVSVETKVVSPIRIVHLSDLHNAEFGRRNENLVKLVAKQAPDLIVMSGDMLNSDEESTEVVTSLITDLSLVAPVYYGYGNHEKSWERRFDRDLRPILEAAGARVVDNDYVELEIKENPIRLGGYMGNYSMPHLTTKDKAQQELEFAFFKDFEDTDRLKLLINHIPTVWVDWHYGNKFSVDVVFSGHYHGGTVRIPILDQGLYAPYVGWFPPFTKGVCSGKIATCVLSAGLGNEYPIPRVNNPPEIIVVDLHPLKDAGR